MEGFAMSSETGGGLCLTRLSGESLTIGPDTTVEVVEVKGNKVKLRIVAPKNLVILRDDTIRTSPRN